MRHIILRIPVLAVTIAADLLTAAAIVPHAGTIRRVSYVARATITGAASPNSRTFTLYNRKQDGTGVTAIARLAMVGGVDATAKVSCDITLSVTAADLVVNENDVLEWESLAVTGAGGLVDSGGLLEIEIAPRLQ